MDRNDFIVKFAEQFEETEPEKITYETRFRDIEEWSSLVHLSIIMMLDREYDVAIDEDDFNKLETVEDIFNYINK
ncbi:acyl carrier protein [Bacteroides cellulosilyticus]|jgi:hypothetical protein|uniref:acyl carrier protein n=1 Tax=Bacteroides cellulosilyticus TaxID=246787 RepID=UPI001898F35D|nr:acyl carrier protein [Bacteroides cellulosilyticus]MCB6592550.1 acyl carrier protein [Bacteroides cellulosilyticus]